MAEGLPEHFASDTRIVARRIQSPGFSKLGIGLFHVAMKGVGRSEVCMKKWDFRIDAAGLFEPRDCLFDTRLEKMGLSDPEIPKPDLRIPGA